MPAVLLAGVVLAGTGLVLARGDDGRLAAATAYAEAWERQDWRALHRLLEPSVRRRVPLARFAALNAEALGTASAQGIDAGAPVEAEDGLRLPVAVATRGFGTVRGDVTLRLVEVDDEARPQRVRWSPEMVFPGLRPGETLRAEMRMPPRAALLARDGRALAEGEGRIPEVDPALAASIVGQLGEPPEEQRASLRRAGVPDGTAVGLSGLERVFDERLRGRPGGELYAGDRVLAQRPPAAGRAVRTTLDVDVQREAVAALGERLGGIAVVRPRTGEVLALSGIAFSGLQPPGSTFKIITLAAALESGKASKGSRYPVETETQIEGFTLENSDGEACGGTLTYAFAHSCNTVFAPLGAEVGAARLVAAAEAFGFNRPVGLDGAAVSTIPAPGEIGDDLAVASSAIGQGLVQATALQMTTVAATIANRGRRPVPQLDRDAVADGRARAERAIAPATARIVARMMREVVRSGTGGAAAIEGVPVAGKTGTAELRSTVSTCTPTPEAPCPPDDGPNPEDTDAWFTSFAPYERPRVAVGVLLVGSGKGGDTAAPAAKQVLQAALRATAP